MQYPFAIVLTCVVLPISLWAQAPADLFTASYSSTLGNWDDESVGNGNYSLPYRTQTRIAGGGPAGLDAFEVVMTGQPATSNPDGNQPYLGHHKALPTFNVGTSRFYRWYEYHEPSNDYVPADGGADFVLKRLVIGNGGGHRMILNIDCNNPGSAATALPHIEVIFDTGTVATSSTFSKGVWHAIQVEIRWDDASSYVKVWLNTDDYNNPTIDYSPGSAPTNNATGSTGFGNYSNDTLLTGHQKTWRDAAFRVATTFDATWHGDLPLDS